MKLYKLSLLALALAGTMVACSDDDYTAPAATLGAFFPVNSPEVVELPIDGNSVDITVRRNSNVSQDQTFNLTSSDPSGLFNIPSSVTFIGQELTANLHVTFDSEKIVMDKEYPVEIKIDGLTNSWGITDYKFSFGRITPLEITNLGVGQYIYSSYLEGYGGYEVVKQVNATTPNLETYIVKDWFNADCDGVDLYLILHKDVILPNGYPYVEMQWTRTNYDNPNYDSIRLIGTLEFITFRYGLSFEEIRDDFEFSVSLTDGTVLLTPETISYYDGETGTFHIFDRAGAFDADGNYLGGWSASEEFLYLPGFPDYELELSYLGFFTNEVDEMTAYGSLYAGADIEVVELYNVATDSFDDALEQINNGEVEGVEIDFTAGDYTNVSVAVPGAGEYTMVAVAYADGEVMNFAYVNYTISGSAAAAGNWESVGTGYYVDGWIVPAFGVDPFDYPWTVEIEKNLDVDGEYRMVNPFGTDNCPVANINTKKTNIVFNVLDPDWPLVAFQFSGFENQGNGRLWISDFNWWAESLGASKEGVLSNAEDRVNASTFYRGMLQVPLPLHASTESGVFSSDVADLGYNWRGGYPSELYFPEATQAATAAKVIRHSVSNNNFLSTLKSMNKEKAEIKNVIRRNRVPELKSNLEFHSAETGNLR